jgi:Cas7 group CRISPR-associated protein Csh2
MILSYATAEKQLETFLSNDDNSQNINNAIDCYYQLQCQMSNINGNPDDNNRPRVIYEEENVDYYKGYTTDICIKRRLRDTAYKMYNMELWIMPGRELSENASKLRKDQEKSLTKIVSEKFWDVRVFGAMIPKPQTKITGPVSVTYTKTLDKICILDDGISSCVGSGETKSGKKQEDGEAQNMGRKAVVKYGVYHGKISVCPYDTKNTNCTIDDLKVLFKSLLYMCEVTKSACRSDITLLGMTLVKHNSKLANTSKIFDEHGNLASKEILNNVKILKIGTLI